MPEDIEFWVNQWHTFVNQYPEIDGSSLIAASPLIGINILHGDWLVVGVFMCAAYLHQQETGEGSYLSEMISVSLQSMQADQVHPFSEEILKLFAADCLPLQNPGSTQ